MWLLDLHFPYLSQNVPVAGLVGGEVGAYSCCASYQLSIDQVAFLRQLGSNVSTQHGSWVQKAITTGSASQRDRSHVTRYILGNGYVIECFEAASRPCSAALNRAPQLQRANSWGWQLSACTWSGISMQERED